MSNAGGRVLQHRHAAARLAVGDGEDADSGAPRVAVHLGRIGIGCQTDLADVAAGEAVFEQAADGIAVQRTLVRLAQVEMGIERDEPDSVQRNAEGMRSRSEEHTSELQSLMRISYAVFCLKKKTNHH